MGVNVLYVRKLKSLQKIPIITEMFSRVLPDFIGP